MSTTTRSMTPRQISRRRALPNPLLGDGRNSSFSHTPMKGAGFFSSSWWPISGDRSEKKMRTRPSYGLAREPGGFLEGATPTLAATVATRFAAEAKVLMSVRQGRQRISLCRSPDVDTPVPLKGWALLLRTPRPLEKSYKKGRHRVGDEMGAAKLDAVSESTLQHTRRV